LFPMADDRLPDSTPSKPAASRSGASLVAAGILASRVIGVVRERVFAHYFGNSGAADAFKAALRIPNVLQNLFGEGVLSGSFIPVYSSLLGRGEEKKANDVAGAVFGILALTVGVIVAAGVTFSAVLVDLIAPGFAAEKRDLTVQLTRIFFPGIGFLVMSAWCLGVLNSHRRFFLSYAAPVFWNIVIILALVCWGSGREQDQLAVITAWSVVAGSIVQFLVQLPSVLSLTGRLRITFRQRNEHVRLVLHNFFPVLIGRGVVQVSAYTDSLLASLLPTGAVAALGYMQTIYLLPIGLFGMSVSAAELPAMSQLSGSDESVAGKLNRKLSAGLRQIAFFIVPSAVGFMLLGDFIVSALYQTGRFRHEDAILVWKVLAVGSLGLVPATLGRLYSSTFYALKDTRTPLRYSLIRVALSVALGVFCSLRLPSLLGLEPMWGLLGLSAASACGATLEYQLLKRGLQRRLGALRAEHGFFAEIWFLALVSSGLARAAVSLLHVQGLFFQAVGACALSGICYLGLSFAIGIPEAKNLKRRLSRR
jgi:putative peptidoglycan lipid II flippase